MASSSVLDASTILKSVSDLERSLLNESAVVSRMKEHIAEKRHQQASAQRELLRSGEELSAKQESARRKGGFGYSSSGTDASSHCVCRRARQAGVALDLSAVRFQFLTTIFV
jgi:hypothetical protein